MALAAVPGVLLSMRETLQKLLDDYSATGKDEADEHYQSLQRSLADLDAEIMKHDPAELERLAAEHAERLAVESAERAERPERPMHDERDYA